MSSDDNNDNNDGVSAPVKKPKSMVNIRDIHSQSASAPARPKSVKTINGRGAGVSTRPVNRDSMSAPAPDNRAKSTTNFNSSHSAPLRPKSTKKLNGTHRGVSQNGPGSAPKRNPSVRPPARLSTSSMINMSASGDSLDPPPLLPIRNVLRPFGRLPSLSPSCGTVVIASILAAVTEEAVMSAN
jgi:hypothetical protein